MFRYLNMPRQSAPDFSHLRPPVLDTAKRGLCVLTPKDVAEVVRSARARTLGRQIDAAARLGVSQTMLSGLERGAGGSQLDLTLGILTDLGFDVVLVPRDPAQSLQAEVR